MKTAISVKGISKQYVLGSEIVSGQNFREMLIGALQAPFKKFSKLRGADQTQERFWALKGVSFEVNEGEVVGIVGLNGAGKSTLLKVLSRITTPTEGEIKYSGRMASLLEVGTGFHPELTGRENIFLNGAILGMTKSEISTKIDEIVAFAEIEKFLDTPVKRYSSGMYVRLAFSVAAHLETDILIVDEVLSVGDARFQSKCIGKMKSVSEQGRTVIFISHNLAAVVRLCDRGLWLENGQVKMDGGIHEVLGAYEKHSLQTAKRLDNGNVAENSQIVVSEVVVGQPQRSFSAPIAPGGECTIAIKGTAVNALEKTSLAIGFYDDRRQRLCILDSSAIGGVYNCAPGAFQFSCNIAALHLIPGRYSINLAIKNGATNILAIERAAVLYVEDSVSTIHSSSEFGPLAVDFEWDTDDTTSKLLESAS